MHDSLQLLPFLLLAHFPLLADGGGATTLPLEAEAQDEGEEELTPQERAERHARERQRVEQETLLGPDGEPVLPGQLPKGASKAARARWQALLDGVLARKPIESFNLYFYLRQRNPDPRRPEVHDTDLAFSFLAPGYLRAELETGLMHLRGPDGDFLITKEEVVPIVAGREGIEDRKQLDEMAAIARNFIGLTDPRTLRLVSLELLEQPPRELPRDLSAEGAKLDWLAVKSPDFYLYRTPDADTSKSPPIYLARLGIDSKSGEVRVALIHLDRDDTNTVDTVRMVHLSKYTRRDGFLVPHQIHIHGADTSGKHGAEWRFSDKPTSELTMRSRVGRLGARLKPEDFRTK